MDERGVTPVIAVVLMVALTVLLASVFAVGATSMADFGDESDRIDELTNGTATPAAAEETGEAPEDDGRNEDSNEPEKGADNANDEAKNNQYRDETGNLNGPWADDGPGAGGDVDDGKAGDVEDDGKEEEGEDDEDDGKEGEGEDDEDHEADRKGEN